MKLNIPESAVALGISETRLRKTLCDIAAPTVVEFRKTRTGVRKTTVLAQDTLELLRAHFEAPAPCAVETYCETVAGTLGPQQSRPWRHNDTETRSEARQERIIISESVVEEQETYTPQELRFLGVSPSSYSSFQGHAPELPSEPNRFMALEAEDPRDETAALSVACRQESAMQSVTSGSGQSVPAAQFNALLYQHNVLREELARVSDYLEGCDHLLGEMVRTISTLEERTRQLERAPGSARGRSNPLSGALRSVSSSVQNALFSRASRAMPKPAEVYYGSVLAGR